MPRLPRHDDWSHVPKARVHPDLKRAADSARTLGAAFVLVGLFAFASALGFRGFGRMFGASQMFAGFATLMLVGPGVWYIVAARLIRQADARAVGISFRIAIGQIVLILGGLFAVFFVDRRLGMTFSIPAFIGTFLIPALGVASVQFARARRIAEAQTLIPAFEPLPPKPVLPLETETPAPRLRPIDGDNVDDRTT